MNSKNSIITAKNNTVIKTLSKLKKLYVNYTKANRRARIIFKLYNFINIFAKDYIYNINLKFFNNKKYRQLDYIKSFLYYLIYNSKL